MNRGGGQKEGGGNREREKEGGGGERGVDGSRVGRVSKKRGEGEREKGKERERGGGGRRGRGERGRRTGGKRGERKGRGKKRGGKGWGGRVGACRVGGVGGVACGGGVNTGCFNADLGAKEGAVINELEVGLEQTISRIPLFQRDHGADWVSAFADDYLGAAHRGNPECVCAMTSMSPDVVRASDEVRTLYQSKMDRIVDLVADGLDGDDPVVRRQRAWALLTGLIGGLTMARAVQVDGNDDMVAEVVSAVKAAAVAAAGPAKSLP